LPRPRIASATAGATRNKRDSLDHRQIIDLVYYHEKTIDECAQILGIPAATVKTRMFYARKKLAELVAQPSANFAAVGEVQK
jgi:predicted DNA-binding protein (UPF0251 family)